MHTRIFVTFCIATLAATWAGAGTLDRVKEAGHLRLGYFNDAKPFTNGEGGEVKGYGAALCQRVAERVKSDLQLPNLVVDWVAATPGQVVENLQKGDIDLFCTPLSMSLARREQVSFSIPVFPGGARAVLRANASPALRDALGDTPSTKPVWRGSPAATTLKSTTVAVVKGSTTERWVTEGIKTFQIGASVAPVADYRTGLEQLRSGKADVLFGDRSAVLAAMDPAENKNFQILDRIFTREQYALVLPRGDDDFRLLVDRALSSLYASDGFNDVYSGAFGPPDDAVRAFFKWNTFAQ